MKKTTTILLLAALVVLVVTLTPGVAYANNGPHGGYIPMTDSCAGCHRAHTAPSSITWTNANPAGAETRSALLLSQATKIEEFCLVCHDATGQGAFTNVQDGYYEDPTNTYGTDMMPLLSGPLGRQEAGTPGYFAHNPETGDTTQVTSFHTTDGGTWSAWGAGAFASTSVVAATGEFPPGAREGAGANMPMDCATCHDPHGSSNYRILKDEVYGVAVGGYSGGTPQDPDPQPYVISNEPGYPVAGFRLHITNRMQSVAGYTPNYTTPMYAKAPGLDANKGMVGWCIGCHTVYASQTSTYNAGDGYGLVQRHRHPMNVELSTFYGPRSLIATTDPNFPLPLAHQINPGAALVNEDSDWIDCLTCHNAHGTTARMSGWANVASVVPTSAYLPDSGSADPAFQGVPPTGDSALLKLNNRGVCEACHNK